VTKTEYDAAGRTYKAYDPKGIVTKYEYDDAGQMTTMTEDDGGIGRITEFTYNGDGQVLTRAAKAPASGEDDQTTTYYYNTSDNTYGTQSAELATTRLLAKVRYPDHDDPQGTSGEVKGKYDLMGRLVEHTDQRGTKVTPAYDEAGRRTMVGCLDSWPVEGNRASFADRRRSGCLPVVAGAQAGHYG
jgi:YD repeat-containing protein